MKDLTKILLLALLVFVDMAAFAGPGEEPDDPDPLPIDSKLFLLILLGIVLAFYTFKKYRKQTN